MRAMLGPTTLLACVSALTFQRAGPLQGPPGRWKNFQSQSDAWQVRVIGATSAAKGRAAAVALPFASLESGVRSFTVVWTTPAPRHFMARAWCTGPILAFSH